MQQYGFDSEDELLGFSLMEKFAGIESTEMFRQLEMAMYEAAFVDDSGI